MNIIWLLLLIAVIAVAVIGEEKVRKGNYRYILLETIALIFCGVILANLLIK
jgi:hypothetical protein